MFLNKLGIFQIKLVNLQRKQKQKCMKSIKEKSEEYVDYYYQKLGISKDEYPTDVVISKADFIAGANYVLDAIEEFMKHNFVYESNLKRLIEQLKEK